MRINYLDGLRGVAILLVVGFHAYSRWPSIVPYGDTYEMFPLFYHGWIGVQLFFLISGFVIFMTLDKTESFKVFVYKRWLRLFPAMLLASVLIYFTVPFFSERPAGEPQAYDLIPGLTLIHPSWWSKLLGFDVASLEAAFWSLYVEFKFYIIAGIIYFTLGRKYLSPLLILLYSVSIFTSFFPFNSGILALDILQRVNLHLALEHFGWFAAGSLFYLYHQSKDEKWFIFALCIALLSSAFVKNLSIYPAIAALLVSALFAISLRSSLIQKILQNRILLFFGFVSYPLYLLHENSMISLVIKMPAYLSWLPSFFYPFVAIALISIASYFIASKYEVMLRKSLRSGFSSLTKLNKAFQKSGR